MADGRSHAISVEVVYALPHSQTTIAIKVPPGTSARQAIIKSEIAALHPELKLESLEAVIFAKRVELSAVVHDNDRVEICRPLLADPKQVRRRRARLALRQGR